jgi:hypothetical protein
LPASRQRLPRLPAIPLRALRSTLSTNEMEANA